VPAHFAEELTMSPIPRLYTPRLCLRPYSLADAGRVQELAGDKRIAATTAVIPHPYPDGAAEQWISTHENAAANQDYIWAVTLAGTRTPGRELDRTDTGHLIGTVGVGRNAAPEHARGVLGYWIGVPYWNKGFATEATRALLKWAFGRNEFHRVTAWHLTKNPASGRVMQKLGMTCEGTLRQHFNKWGEFHDVTCYGILADEWHSLRQKPAWSQPKTLHQKAAVIL